jgi:predicted small integral membrane protein
MLKLIAYLCIWSSPIQISLVFWGIYIVSISDYSLLSLSNLEFITNQLGFLLPVIDWMYTWMSKPLLDWVLSIPIILHQAVKAVVSTWFGLWILSKLKRKNNSF